MENPLDPLHLNSSERLIKLRGQSTKNRTYKGQKHAILLGDQKITRSLRIGVFRKLLFQKPKGHDLIEVGYCFRSQS